MLKGVNRGRKLFDAWVNWSLRYACRGFGVEISDSIGTWMIKARTGIHIDTHTHTHIYIYIYCVITCIIVRPSYLMDVKGASESRARKGVRMVAYSKNKI